MVMSPFSLREDYWESFKLQDEDIEFLYNYLLETETPLTSQELVVALVDERIHRETRALEQEREAAGELYQPKGKYSVDQTLVFPALGWRRGQVVAVRPGVNPDLGDFQVVKVAFEDGEQREFAAGLDNHALNDAPVTIDTGDGLDPVMVLEDYSEDLIANLEEGLVENHDFVRIAGRWFPRALLVDINVGHLNLAEAVLDMAGGGPASTQELIEQIGLTSEPNANLLDFSFDLALQEDPRFDEVGPAGKVLWYLQRLEPPEVLEPPQFLRFQGIEHDRSKLTRDMQELERKLDDELSPISSRFQTQDEVEVNLILPHWYSGTLPLSARLRHLFPTAYEAPRIRFMLVDGDTGNRFPGWVVRDKRYVFGLKEWYKNRSLIPGSTIKVSRGKEPGEVIIRTDSRRSSREWIRTALIGSDGGVVFAMLKQVVSASFDERMAIAVPDEDALAAAHTRAQRMQFRDVVVNMVRELAKLNPQSHVHASELYAAVNVVRRSPPAPIMALLATDPTFVLVGDLYYRFND